MSSHRIVKNKSFGLYFLSFMVLSPIWIFLGLIIGGFLGYQYNSTAFFFGLICSPIALSYFHTSRKINKLNESADLLESNVKKLLENTDYYYTSAGSAMGVDVVNNIIVVVATDRKLKLLSPITFDAKIIKDYKAYSPGHTLTDVIGHASTMDKHSVLTKNINSQVNSSLETGLYFSLDNILMPKVFAKMEYNEAEKWLLIIEKILNQTIESQPSPMFYPPQ
ncbi:hypothetical protein EGC82_16020 [Shewanella livingstonensis]|uniref:Uncharacterized protein n=1 Tax=Shewanella livingstonensis TaxID=150120 RepID=A0A3G8LXB0_9GAMM|nr:hypothetical protein [Shewanella livingstonensis]AZG74127.1 hypothetical protein EGC82_16020 [Shewanella livingstonensis]